MAKEATRKSYDEILKIHPQFEGVISEKSWSFIGISDEATVDYLRKDWIANVEKNINSKRFKRHGGVNDLIGFGKNKALVGIGAGASLNKNKHILKQIHDIDGTKHPDERDFIFIASNHMFKPLLKEGIIPDFVMVADASDVVLDQLTKDIPESGRNCILLAGLHCSSRVLKKWEKQGRMIKFYITGSPGVGEKYEELTGDKKDSILIAQGGNVLNSSWSVGVKYFNSSVFMALGNDLSYPIHEDIDERRKGYYADGDYSSNIGTERDEARHPKEGWMGFSLKRRKVVLLKQRMVMTAEDLYDIEIDPILSTGTLWVYKSWLESIVLANANVDGLSYHYYNCSEGGISGVMCKDDTVEGRKDINNWFLMDSVCKRWRTRMFEDAIEEFIKAKEVLRWGLPVSGVLNATGLAMQS